MRHIWSSTITMICGLSLCSVMMNPESLLKKRKEKRCPDRLVTVQNYMLDFEVYSILALLFELYAAM